MNMGLAVRNIIVIGGGGHAGVLLSVLKKSSWQIVGYTDPRDGGPILGIPYLGGDEALLDLSSHSPECRAALGVGKIDVSSTRVRLAERIVALGFDFPAIVSPQAVVNEGVELGDGAVVFDGAVINTGTAIGRFCILNTNSTVEHDCHLGDDVHIAPGAVLGGGVVVADNCFIGAGATVVQNVTICTGCIVGAGSTVIHDITIRGTYAGNPARKL